MPVGDRDLEVLGHLEAVDDLADPAPPGTIVQGGIPSVLTDLVRSVWVVDFPLPR